MTEYYKRYLCRHDPWPDDVNKTFAELSTSLYRTMWGPSEFTATGSLRTYERARDIPLFLDGEKIKVGKIAEITFVPGAVTVIVPANRIS